MLYTAEEAGIITRHDLRVRAPEVVFANDCYGDEISIDNHQVTFQETFSRSLGSVKALTQSHAFGGQQLLVAGKGFKIGLLDLRLTNSSFSSIEGVSNRFHVENNFVKTWSPYYSYADAEHGEHESPVHYTCLSKNRERSRSGIYQSSSQVSASGMHVSGDGRSFVASYQGDQVYTFNMMSSQSQVGATSIIGGHINYATFIKSVRYFGPRDEYVLSGSDSGHVWIWNSSPKQPNSGRNCELVNVLLAGTQKCVNREAFVNSYFFDRWAHM